jgi:hypothetical protein
MDQEGQDEVARNNLVADCDDALFQVEGVKTARIFHNTAVAQTGFAVFRLNAGNTATAGVSSGNDDVVISDNLIVSTTGSPQYARNDANAGSFTFGRTLWAGTFANAGSPGPNVPAFPQPGDVVAASSALASVVVQPDFAGLAGLTDAEARYALAPSSPAKAAGEPRPEVALDILGKARSMTAPSIGAEE